MSTATTIGPWSTSVKRIVNLYASRCGVKSHKDQPSDSCKVYKDNVKNRPYFEGTVSHEFGHVMGLADMYGDENFGYEPISDDEVIHNGAYGLPSGAGVMYHLGEPTVNDIEMILIAFCDNKFQYYVPYHGKQKKSKAIRGDTEYVKKGDANVYVWNDQTKSFEVK